MLDCFYKKIDQPCVSIYPLAQEELAVWLKTQSSQTQNWVASLQFEAEPGALCLLPNEDGQVQAVLFGVNDDFWLWGGLGERLPAGHYVIHEDASIHRDALQLELALFAWGLGSYRFNAYCDKPENKALLCIPDSLDEEGLQHSVRSVFLIRDLINTPSEDMGPADIAEAAKHLAEEFEADIHITSGQALLEENYPAIYAVGKGSDRESQFIDLTWGDAKAPKLTLVGKGVSFDTGGLDLKSASAMGIMKKDMGGAAHALGLAYRIMAEKLPVRLRMLIPSAENAISANSYRPGDVVQTRAGLTVEVTNTDAEGRMVLCDALAEAVTDQPDYVIDFSTLTGAARVALGPDLASLFTNNEQMAESLTQAAKIVRDPIWRLPLVAEYEEYLKSEVADLVNSASVSHAGAITAALFLQRFVPKEICWAHFDMSAWNYTAKPGRPIGGEAMAIRGVFEFLRQRYLA